MAKMAVLSSLINSNEGDSYGLLFTASPPALNSKRIYRLQYMAYSVMREPCQLPGWIKTRPAIVSQPGFEPPTFRILRP